MSNSDNQLYHSLMLGDYSGEGDLIQLITDDDDEGTLKNENFPKEIPILSVRNTVPFSGVVIPITVGQAKVQKIGKKKRKREIN